MRREHYSLSTERTYCNWVRQFIQFHKMLTREALFVEQKNKVEDFL
ncbi:MAG: integrase, partial [Nitrospina sp.]|nr:integrase [Nitrospina sp.]